MKITKMIDEKIQDFSGFNLYKKPSKILISEELFNEFVKEWEPFLIDFQKAKRINNTIEYSESKEYKGIKIEIVPEKSVIVII